MFHKMFFTAFLFFYFCNAVFASPDTWLRPAQPPQFENLTSVTALEDESQLIVSSKDSIYQQKPDGNWALVKQFQGLSGNILHLLSFEAMPHTLFVLTQDGLFRGNLLTHDWHQVFHGDTLSEKRVLSFAVLPEDQDHWFAGTADGLFESDDAGKTWYRFSDFANHEPVSVLKFIRGYLLAGTKDQLYVSENLSSFQPVFSLGLGIQDDPDIFSEEELDNPADSLRPLDISIYDLVSSDKNCHELWLATKKGVFQSLDCGKRWSRLPTHGLKTTVITRLIFAPNNAALFAASGQGIYRYHFQKGLWQELYNGLAHPRVHDLFITSENNNEIIWAVTGDGILNQKIEPAEESGAVAAVSPEQWHLFREITRLEPSALEIHKAVIRYSNLKNWKTKRWHGESRLRSLMPKLSFGKSYGWSNNIDLDRQSTLEPDVFIDGPGNIDKDWDMDISWDFGDLIWSSSQTSIDSREKLMVELRHDMLGEATRLYYERRRLQMEIVFAPAPTESEHYQRLIRMEELTALLDSMTEGFLSARLEKIYGQHSELNRLWEFQPPKFNI